MVISENSIKILSAKVINHKNGWNFGELITFSGWDPQEWDWCSYNKDLRQNFLSVLQCEQTVKGYPLLPEKNLGALLFSEGKCRGGSKGGGGG